MNHPVVQTVLQVLSVVMLLMLVQRFLGLWALLLLVLVCGWVAVVLYMLRHHRTMLARVYEQPVLRTLIDFTCRVTGSQVPVEPSERSPLDRNLMLREHRDFEWCSRRLKDKVFGHDEAIEQLVTMLKSRTALRIQSPKSGDALATCIVVGPEGIGKRWLAQSLAGLMYKEGVCSRFDLTDSDAASPSTAALFGDSGREGALIRSVKRRPHQVLFLENAHRASTATLARVQEILQTGHCTDPRSGGRVSFEHVVLVLTVCQTPPVLDKDPEGLSPRERDAYVQEALADHSRLEHRLVSLAHAVVVMRRPDRTDVARVIASLMQEECARYGVELDYVAPEILAEEVGDFNESLGFELSQSRLARKLEQPILAASVTNPPRVILTPETW